MSKRTKEQIAETVSLLGRSIVRLVRFCCDMPATEETIRKEGAFFAELLADAVHDSQAEAKARKDAANNN